MSAEAAKTFGISQEDLLRFLGKKESSQTSSPPLQISEHGKQSVLIVSIILFAVAVLTCGCTLCLWFISNKRKQYQKSEETNEKAELACSEDSINGSVNHVLSLPQISEKPKLSSGILNAEKEPFDEEELRKLQVEDIDLTSNYYVNRERLQVNIKRVVISNVNEQLSQNAYMYLVVTLLPGNKDIFESELRPVAEENYFEEAPEFNALLNEVTSRVLKISVYACDRFSQHRLVNEYTYSLNVPQQVDDGESIRSILPVQMTEISRSHDNQFLSKEVSVGELLFSLCFMPTSGRLTFVALKGKNIHDGKENILATYLRVSLLVSGKVMKTVQTSSVRRSTFPVYNEAFVFHTPLERIKETDLHVSVMIYSSSESSPKLLGKVAVGLESDNHLGRKHWEAMLTSPRKPVAQWHSFNNNA